MGYLNDYLTVVRTENLDKFEAIFRDRNDYENFGILTYKIASDQQGLPYLKLTVDFKRLGTEGENPCAMLRLLYLDDNQRRFENLSGAFLYLPVICVAESYPPEMVGKFSPELSIEHELIHLQDILTLYDRDPTHQQRRKECSFDRSTTEEEVRAGLDLDLFELFYLEPRAYRNDFQKGDQCIHESAFGQMVRITFEKESDFVQLHLFRATYSTIRRYESKLKNLGLNETEEIEAVINRYGKDVFGEAAYDRLQEIRQEYCTSIIKALASGDKKTEFQTVRHGGVSRM